MGRIDRRIVHPEKRINRHIPSRVGSSFGQHGVLRIAIQLGQKMRQRMYTRLFQKEP